MTGKKKENTQKKNKKNKKLNTTNQAITKQTTTQS
jgi:hypothetical protein